MLSHWGTELFSFWAIVLSARAIILFLSDGYVRYTLNQYNLLFHQDESKANEILSAGISFLCLFSLGICTLIAGLFFLFPHLSSFVFNTHNPLFDYLPLCLIIYLVGASVQNMQRLYAGTKEARGLVWHNMVLEVVLIFLEIVGLGLLMVQGAGFSVVLFADSGIILLTALVYLLHLSIRYPLKGLMRGHNIILGAGSFIKATQLYASNFFEKLSTDGLVLLLSFFRFDKAAIALFATVRTIVNTPLLAQNLLLNTYTPQLQKDFALRNEEGLAKLFTHIRLRVGIVLLAGIVCCYPLYEPVFVYWTKAAIVYEPSFMMLMLMMAVVNLYGLSFSFVFKGLNVLPQMLGLMLFKTLLILFGFYVAQQNIEMIAWALLFAEFVVSIILLPILLHRYWQKQQMSFSIMQSYLSFIPYLISALLLFLLAT